MGGLELCGKYRLSDGMTQSAHNTAGAALFTVQAAYMGSETANENAVGNMLTSSVPQNPHFINQHRQKKVYNLMVLHA